MTRSLLSPELLPPGLRARTEPIDGTHGASLLEGASEGDVVFTCRGVGLRARGIAARIELPSGLADHARLDRVRDALAAVPHEGAAVQGAGPIVFGALPFDPSEPATLIVPAWVETRSADGAVYRTTVFAAGERPPESTVPDVRTEPESFHLRSERSFDDWRELVTRALGDIARGHFEKVVLARAVRVETDRPVRLVPVLRRLEGLFPECTVFHIGGFFGASPELVIARRGDAVLSHPLAGTRARAPDPEGDLRVGEELLGHDKSRREHRVVIDAVAAALRPACETLEVPHTPSIVRFRNVMHLGTLLKGRLRDPAQHALGLVARVHPTPAVCGTPTDTTLAWLRAHERLDRGLYAGAVGWMDARGDGEWVLGIRSARVFEDHIRVVAGVGVVAGSDPEEELVETQWKNQAILSALVRL
jgi:menaquinone-specific isochorismate synthase